MAEASEYHFIELGQCISSIDFSPNYENNYFAVGLVDESVLLWKSDFKDIKNLKYQNRWDNHSMGVVDVKFNSSGDRLAVSSLDSNIKIWNTNEGVLVSTIQCNPMENWQLAYSTEKEVVTAGQLGKVTFNNVESGEILSTLDSSEYFASAIAVHKDGKTMAVGNAIGQIFIYDLQDEKAKPIVINCHNKMIRSLSFTRDGLKLASVSDDQTLKIIDLVQLEVSCVFNGHKGNINCVDCSPKQDNKIATCSYDKSIQIWDLSTQSVINTIQYHQDNVWAVKFAYGEENLICSGAENGILAFHMLSQ